MRRSLLRPLWVLLALAFLLEAWLWDHLGPPVAWLADRIAWARLKERLRRLIERLPPYAALSVFIVPVLVLLPLKFLEVYLLATRSWFAAVTVLIAAKLIGLGVTAFVFDATRDKLLQIGWFVRTYDWFIHARAWAHAQTEPIRRQIAQWLWLVSPHRAGRFVRLFLRMRRRA